MEFISLAAMAIFSLGSIGNFFDDLFGPKPNPSLERPAGEEIREMPMPAERGFERSEEHTSQTRPTSETGLATEAGQSADEATVSVSGESEVTIYTDGTYRYIESNGIPNHDTGTFPNSGNPNTISEQDISVQVLLNPVYTGAMTPVQLPGIALNGILLEPGTAEREGSYNIEGLQDTYNLGMDQNNAHVQPNGTYHYHGVPEGYLANYGVSADLVQVGWAADGFPMYHDHGGTYTSGYELIGTRADGTTADGTYTQDFEFTGVGNLDECNGAWVGEEYAYFITDEFPYISRCLNGTPDESFQRGGGQSGMQAGGGTATGGMMMPPQSGGGEESMMPPMQGSNQTGAQAGPPTEALSSCSGLSMGSSCSFTGMAGESISGTCQSVPEGTACVPAGGPPLRR